MMPFVASAFDPSKGSEGLRTEDVSRISYQLLSAVDHCAKHRVIHRDIKPENVMFCTKAKNSELRLIDFGSGTLDNIEMKPVEDGGEVERHHTFAGSAFYISPEMFLRTYTSKTGKFSDLLTNNLIALAVSISHTSSCMFQMFGLLARLFMY